MVTFSDLPRYALFSLTNKEGSTSFAKALKKLGFSIVATGGTQKFFEENGIEAKRVEDLTGFPEILKGRVKTLHPLIFGGILARRESESDLMELKEKGIPLIDIVVVNLYPFDEMAERGLATEGLMEFIDIGGVSLIRAAVKNHRDVLVVTDPEDYERVIEALKNGVSEEFKRELALKALSKTALYEATIHRVLFERWGKEDHADPLILTYKDPQSLRYGENPHQSGSFYPGNKFPLKKIWGKELSYNNLLDMDGALGLLLELGDEKPAAVIIKHTSPCGAARGKSSQEAFQGAWDSDPVSAFGGILALNRAPDEELCEKLNEVFLEVILAPKFPEKSLNILKKKKMRRLVEYGSLENLRDIFISPQVRSILGGLLYQEPDRILLPDDLEDIDGNPLAPPEKRDVWFATAVVKHAKSNAIVVAKDEKTVGIGSGLPSRVDAVKVALNKAGERAKGAVLSSDAFFPFPDSIELAAKSGVKLIVQPGGSVRDKEVIERAKSLGIKMILTGIRHFRH